MRNKFLPTLPFLLAMSLALSACGQPVQPKQVESVLSEERRIVAVEIIDNADAEALEKLFNEINIWLSS